MSTQNVKNAAERISQLLTAKKEKSIVMEDFTGIRGFIGIAGAVIMNGLKNR